MPTSWGFSTYVWNGRISLEIAHRLKELKPSDEMACSQSIAGQPTFGTLLVQ
jgi:hypothetical protein